MKFHLFSLMDTVGSHTLCFPNLNSSCRRLPQPHSQTALLSSLLAFVSLLTVMLNLLVITSISHFRQLHTPTNALLLSLAVSDLVVGLLVMPIEGLRYVETCWMLGGLMCALAPYISYSVIATSLGHMVLIPIDRYVAICDPLLYSSKITLSRVIIVICVCWVCSLVYNGCMLMGHLGQPDRSNTCHGECVVVISHIAGTVDLFVSLIVPCTVMVVLYMRVSVVAASHLRAIGLQTAAAPTSKASDRKAARTLGIVIAVFLMCYSPIYDPTLAGWDTSSSLWYYAVFSWLTVTNSLMNPLIYALFYPWFRKAIKLIFTLRILQPHSREAKLL